MVRFSKRLREIDCDRHKIHREDVKQWFEKTCCTMLMVQLSCNSRGVLHLATHAVGRRVSDLRSFPRPPQVFSIHSKRTPDSCGELLRNPSGGYFPNENIKRITRRRSVSACAFSCLSFLRGRCGQCTDIPGSGYSR